MREHLYSGKNYEVYLDPTFEDKEKYTIINIETGVVELRDNLLPRVLDTVIQLDTSLDEALLRWNDHVKPPVKLGLVED